MLRALFHGLRSNFMKFLSRFPDPPLHCLGKILVPAVLPKKLLTVAANDRVLHKHTRRRRRANIEYLLADVHAGQEGIMVELLRAMAQSMISSFERVNGERYNGSLLSLPAGHPRRVAARSVPANSDAVESYFGEASYMRSRNANQTEINLNFNLAIIETDLGNKLAALHKEDPEYVELLMLRARKYTRVHLARLRAREDALMATRMAAMEAALKKCAANKLRNANTRTKNEELAEEWARDSPSGAADCTACWILYLAVL